MWLGFPNEPIDHRRDIEIAGAEHWPTAVDRDSFREITGLADFPRELANLIDDDHLNYRGNGSVVYRLRGRFVRLTALWGVRANRPEGDTHLAIARGSRATIKVQHEVSYGPGAHVFVVPANAADKSKLISAIKLRRPAVDLGDRIHVPVPATEQTGHESHFASVLREFISYFNDRSLIPLWERPNLLAKYHVTTARPSGG
jgi:hypothetical protein